MAVPTLKLNLAPPSTLWRLNHALIGWAALVAGGAILAGSLGLTLRAYRQASQMGRLTVARTAQTRMTEDSQRQVLDELRSVDVAKELPRWRLAERIYTERSLPWSRLTAELERSMVPDVRLKALQRTRGSDMKVQVKIKGEARTRDAEAFFMESLQKNTFFEQVILEREGERQGGGVDFEYTLAAFSVPPPYAPLPKYGPQPKVPKQPVKPAVAPVAARPAPSAPAPRPVQPAVPPTRLAPDIGNARVFPGVDRPQPNRLFNPANPANPSNPTNPRFPAPPRPPRRAPNPNGGEE